MKFIVTAHALKLQYSTLLTTYSVWHTVYLASGPQAGTLAAAGGIRSACAGNHCLRQIQHVIGKAFVLSGIYRIGIA